MSGYVRQYYGTTRRSLPVSTQLPSRPARVLLIPGLDEPVLLDEIQAAPVLISRPVHETNTEDEVYLEKMQDILSAYPCIGVPPEPSPIMGGIYLGTSANAENFRVLKANKISYILNCAGGHPMEFRRLRELYAPDDTGIVGYEELNVDDKEFSNIRDSFTRAHKFIDFARSRRGQVLVHCPGVSRSGAIVISYMVANGTPLLQAIKAVKQHRRVVLCNTGFMKQLISYARARGMLDPDVKGKAESSNKAVPDSAGILKSRFYRYRVNAASMPRIIHKAY